MKSTTNPPQQGLPATVQRWIENALVQHGIMFLIVINAIILGLETEPLVMEGYGSVLLLLDHVILGVFVIEILLRIYAHRLGFFRDAWSIFDFIVVGIALVPASGPFAVLRALRVLRVLRILTLVPSMRRVVGALLSSIALVLLLIYYVFAVIATNLFIAIIVNAMHTFTEQETQETKHAVSDARDHIEADLHQEMKTLRGEIAELKLLLQGSSGRQGNGGLPD